MTFKTLLYLTTGMWWNLLAYHLAKRCAQASGLDMLALGTGAVAAFAAAAIALLLMLGAGGNQLAKLGAIWHVCGLVLTCVMGTAVYGETPTPMTLLGLALGAASVVVLSL